MKRFSVIVPVYNVETYLPDMLESACRQSFLDFELILVDDGSTDSCARICDSFQADHPETIVIHKPNGGLISARREGLKASSGEYILFCDADDMLHDDALFELDKVISKEGPDLIIYNADIYDGNSRRVFFEHEMPEGNVPDKKVIYDKLFLSYSMNSMCLKAVRRDIADTDYDYSGFYKCTVAEDMLQSAPLIKAAGNIYYLDRSLYDYRVTSGMTHKCNPDYYFSNLKINRHVVKQLADEGIEDLDIKAAMHLLIAAYAGTTQMKYAENFDSALLDRIRLDADFIDSWELAYDSPYSSVLSTKQKLILKLLHDRKYTMIKLLLRIRGGR